MTRIYQVVGQSHSERRDQIHSKACKKLHEIWVGTYCRKAVAGRGAYGSVGIPKPEYVEMSSVPNPPQ